MSIWTDTCDWASSIADTRPLGRAQIEPLLVAISPETPIGAGTRLPSEAELEWILRDAGRIGLSGISKPMTVKNRWSVAAASEPPIGLNRLFDGPQESRDRWASGPLRGQPITRTIHRAWQDVDEELLAMHPALRRGGRAVISFRGLRVHSKRLRRARGRSPGRCCNGGSARPLRRSGSSASRTTQRRSSKAWTPGAPCMRRSRSASRSRGLPLGSTPQHSTGLR